MHMTSARMFKHIRTYKFNKAMERQIRQRDVDMTSRCGGMDFSLYGEKGGEIVEGVATFKYLGQTLDQNYNN